MSPPCKAEGLTWLCVCILSCARHTHPNVAAVVPKLCTHLLRFSGKHPSLSGCCSLPSLIKGLSTGPSRGARAGAKCPAPEVLGTARPCAPRWCHHSLQDPCPLSGKVWTGFLLWPLVSSCLSEQSAVLLGVEGSQAKAACAVAGVVAPVAGAATAGLCPVDVDCWPLPGAPPVPLTRQDFRVAQCLQSGSQARLGLAARPT